MFRFTIRELVLVTVIVAMGVAWGVDRWRLAALYDRPLTLCLSLDNEACPALTLLQPRGDEKGDGVNGIKLGAACLADRS